MTCVRSLALVVALAAVSPTLAQKEAVDGALRKRSDIAWEMARKIWGWAEVGYKEKQSAALLADALEKAGFQIERGVAKIPTAFVATLGAGRPIIGIMGEYDALPGLSQEAVPHRQPLKETDAGHGCGHHLFGVAAAEACLALGEQVRSGKIKGTLRFYGCPAEEGGAARAFLVRAGLFKDCAAVLHWHPSSTNFAGTRPNLARIAVKFRFHGISSHAAASPEKGRSALDAVELTNHAAQLLREHTPQQTRIHHIITDGGAAPNVVPDFSEVFYYVRHPEADVVQTVYERLVKCAQAGALATETKLEVLHLGGTQSLLPNRAVEDLIGTNLRRLNDLAYDADEVQFARKLQESLGEKVALESIQEVYDPGRGITSGSTDVSDVSWVVPTGGFSTACWVPGTSGHSWQATAAGGMSIGRKGMQLAARVLAASAWDLFHAPKVLTAARAELNARLEGRPYRSLLLPGQEPPLNYRDPPRKR